MSTQADLIISLLIYFFIFILPVISYIKFKDMVNPLDFFKLNKNIRKGVMKGFSISILFILFLIIKKIIFGWENINLNIGLLWFTNLAVGILEEIPFRGFLLQKLNNHMNFISANILTTVLFVMVHIPIWMITKVNVSQSIISIALVSYILGYLFKESDSLWVPIICHSIFNLCIFIGLG